jgi:hypothetical protein
MALHGLVVLPILEADDVVGLDRLLQNIGGSAFAGAACVVPELLSADRTVFDQVRQIFRANVVVGDIGRHDVRPSAE